MESGSRSHELHIILLYVTQTDLLRKGRSSPAFKTAKRAIQEHEEWLKDRFTKKETQQLIELLTRIHEGPHDHDVPLERINTPLTIMHTSYDSDGDQFRQEFRLVYQSDALTGVAGLCYLEEEVVDIITVRDHALPSLRARRVRYREIGWKLDLPDNSLRLNGAIFATDYTDLQFTYRVGVAPYLANAGAASIDTISDDCESTAYSAMP